MGPKLAFSDELHATKYRGPGEDFREAMNRVASALSDNDAHFHAFRDILLDMRFLPAGRIQAAMGSDRAVTPYNCYVSGTIEDSFCGLGGIMDRATEAAATMRLGGGIGYDFSRLRPRGDLITTLNSRASGPVSFMEIYDAVCNCVASAGHRRGAQMGVLRVDHPDIMEFVRAKQNATDLRAFNVSVGVTDEFMIAVKGGTDFDLRFGGKTYRTIDARALWEAIMRSTWDWAEPGVLFIDRINQLNNLYYCETISATNPCGEQPLPPYGACLLGSFNLTKYVSGDGFDYSRFRRDIPIVVRAMDNVIDRAIYPLIQQEDEAKTKRRMGLGVTGLANALEAMGMEYGSPAFADWTGLILATLRNEAYAASVELAKEKGPFPLFDADKYWAGKFIRKLPVDLQADICSNGIRNSHLTSIAPTGTISLCADNVSSGIEPVFAYSFDRIVNMEDGPRMERVEDYGVRVFGVRGKQSKDVTVDEHLRVLLTAQEFVDSAVSKTCNVAPETPWEDFKSIYMRAWEGGAKGCTTFNTGGKRGGILQATDDASEGASCWIDPNTGKRECE